MNIDTIKNLYGECVIYGPYTRSDGRKHSILYYKDTNIRITVSYPKLLLESYLNRKLTEDETVDHIDGDFTNDDVSNYRILSRADNARTGKNANIKEELVEVKCLVCETISVKKASIVRGNLRKSPLAGKFCGKKCARQYQISQSGGIGLHSGLKSHLS